MSKQLVPKNGHIVIMPIEELEETVGNIIIPDLGREKPEIGEVVGVSEVFNYHIGQYVMSEIEVGDKVLIPKMGSQRIVMQGQEYYVVKQTEVLAVIK